MGINKTGSQTVQWLENWNTVDILNDRVTWIWLWFEMWFLEVEVNLNLNGQQGIPGSLGIKLHELKGTGKRSRITLAGRDENDVVKKDLLCDRDTLGGVYPVLNLPHTLWPGFFGCRNLTLTHLGHFICCKKVKSPFHGFCIFGIWCLNPYYFIDQLTISGWCGGQCDCLYFPRTFSLRLHAGLTRDQGKLTFFFPISHWCEIEPVTA